MPDRCVLWSRIAALVNIRMAVILWAWSLKLAFRVASSLVSWFKATAPREGFGSLYCFMFLCWTVLSSFVLYYGCSTKL